ncbi:hypothetical protein BD410DRAFT_870451 [Rickenella mellea]|uniref:RNA polymerase II subunit A C-terminal domain phosphatase n=1 Tax=Rickenella mellea TaxID=50990 RepID=A0A4Y7QLB7_9AGAM|nr:hypothetical protein BD410DRAFT_870451 [Rickenella mellea]
MTTPTDIHFPDTLPFPFKILSLSTRAGDDIRAGSRLLNYSFLHIPPNNPEASETRFGSWDATFDGQIQSWKVKVGEMITKQKAQDKPAVLIVEPCKHGVQVNGLCALCGMDMEQQVIYYVLPLRSFDIDDSFDYTGRPESSRATIQMTHSASGPTVSLEEAQRIERETATHLLRARKLSLIVDLDQTIVHATVDPTVGEWIAEGEAWEERQAAKKRKQNGAVGGGDDDSDDSSDDSDIDEDDVNANWEALKDVKKFRLAPDVFASGGFRIPWRSKGKDKAIEMDGCLYYVKPRPGWQEFLAIVAKTYEMHVYTMGTRAYAEEVCAAIDPGGRIFGGRILSRDESGSLTQKSLRRLFPCDTSMVVIIDDRADVWEWSPNLVKVIPYDFFVGIGDINSTFLPKVDPLHATNVPSRPISPIGAVLDSLNPQDTAVPSEPSTAQDSSDLIPPEQEDSDPRISDVAKNELITQNTLALEAQVEERPLARKQEELLESVGHPVDEMVESQPPIAASNPESPPVHLMNVKPTSKALLRNDDVELIRVGKLLEDIHKKFFDAYDARVPEDSSRKRKKEYLSRKSPPPEHAYDVRVIIPQLRMNTFAGINVVFSGVIPTNTKMKHEDTEIWRMARAFGANCQKDLSPDTTHVVASKRGTQKVDMAQKQGGVFVVWLTWFTDSLAKWERQDERVYLLDEPTSVNPQTALAVSPPSDPTNISTDTDPEGPVDDEDVEILETVRDDPTPQAENEEIASDGFDPGEVDWQRIHDEVEAAMMESDEEEERSSESGRTSGNASEDDGMGDSVAFNVPGRTRKRLRSLTPSENRSSHLDDEDILRSPLAKRKKMAAERSGLSKLKEGISISDISSAREKGTQEQRASTPTVQDQDKAGEDEDEDDSEDGDDEDDFLTRELEEELG